MECILERLLKQNGLKVIRKSWYHYHIIGGPFLINYYPTQRSAYINGMTQGKRGISNEELVQFALGKLVPDGVRIHGRKNMGPTKQKMYKKNPMCSLCGKFMEYKDTSVDHKIPISKGGSNRPDNLQLAHRKCNLDKGNSLPNEDK